MSNISRIVGPDDPGLVNNSTALESSPAPGGRQSPAFHRQPAGDTEATALPNVSRCKQHQTGVAVGLPPLRSLRRHVERVAERDESAEPQRGRRGRVRPDPVGPTDWPSQRDARRHGGENVAISRTSWRTLITPMQFGPTTRMPWALANRSNSSPRSPDPSISVLTTHGV